MTAKEILDFYYPNTDERQLPGRMVRVWIMEDEGQDLRIASEPRLSLLDLSTHRRFRLKQAASQWRIAKERNRLRVEYLTRGQWKTWASRDGRDHFPGPLRIAGDGVLRLLLNDGSWSEYRGTLEAVPRSSEGFITVNRVSMERYLDAVVSREMDQWFEAEALKTEAVLARTYATNRVLNRAPHSGFDICSSSWRCITYGGVRHRDPEGVVRELEAAPGIQAVRATRGRVRVFEGRPIYAEASASNGGWVRAWDNWPPRPYLVAKPDPFDAATSPYSHWDASVKASSIEAKYPSIGRFLGMTVLERDGSGAWGGRVVRVRLTGSRGNLELSGDDFSSWAGLKSDWWTIDG